EREGDKNGDADFQQLIQKILAAQPDNLAALLEMCRIAAKRADRPALQAAVARIVAHANAWPAEGQEQFSALQSAGGAGDLRGAAQRTTLLRNVLWRVPEFRRDFAVIKAPQGEDIEPLTRLVKLEAPTFRVAAPDSALVFEARPIFDALNGKWQWVGALRL